MLTNGGNCMFFKVINVFCVSLKNGCTLKVEIMFVHLKIYLYPKH